MATVVESDAGTFKTGDRVLIIPPNFDGWSQYLSVDPKWLIPIPDSLSFDHAVFAQLLGCIIWALKKVDNVYDQNVAVVGQGAAGLFFTQLLSNMGAKRVIGLDLDDHRLQVARQMGATHTINPTSTTEFKAAVADLTHGQMADLVIEAVGIPETIDMSLDIGKEFGDIMAFGIPKVSPIPFDLWKALRMQQRILTTVGTQDEPNLSSFRLGMDMIADGRIDPTPLISHTLPFDQLGRAIKMAKLRTDNAVKILMNMQHI